MITVREGMALPAGARPGAAASGGGARGPARARAPSANRIITPRPASEEPRQKRESLEGAFKRAISSPDISPSDSMQAVGPPGFDVEWYVSIDGDQQGPFSLVQAQHWVQSKDFDDELYCWSEGFDDWLPVEQVDELAGLRKPPADDDAFDDERTVVGAPPEFGPGGPTVPSAPSPMSPMTYPSAAAPVPEPSPPAIPIAAAQRAPLPEPGPRRSLPEPNPRPMADGSPAPSPVMSHHTPTPQPLFAATLEQMEASAPTGIREQGSNGKNSDLLQMPPPDDTDIHDGDLELDIGEASRVVKLPHLAQMALQGPGTGGAMDPAALPGVGGQRLGDGTGPQAQVSNRTGPAMGLGLPSFDQTGPRPELLQPKRRAGMLPLIIGGGVVLAAVIGLLVFLAVRGDEVDEPIARTTSQHSTDELGKDFTADLTATRPTKDKGTGDGAKTPADDKKHNGSGRRRPPKNDTNSATKNSGSQRSGGADEVDLNKSNGGDDKVIQGHLDPSVVPRMYRQKGFALRRCYERALKRDPFLKSLKATVSIRVAPSGVVTNVSIPKLRGNKLGSCMVTAIRRWRFQKSTKGLATTFPVVFKS